MHLLEVLEAPCLLHVLDVEDLVVESVSLQHEHHRHFVRHQRGLADLWSVNRSLPIRFVLRELIDAMLASIIYVDTNLSNHDDEELVAEIALLHEQLTLAVHSRL